MCCNHVFVSFVRLIGLPALVGDDALLQQLLVLVHTDRQPVAELAVIQGVHHLEDVPTAEGEALRGLLLVLKVGPDEEGVSTPRHQYIIVDWKDQKERDVLCV